MSLPLQERLPDILKQNSMLGFSESLNLPLGDTLVLLS